MEVDGEGGESLVKYTTPPNPSQSVVQARYVSSSSTSSASSILERTMMNHAITNVKIHQLERGGGAFTKADLVAILAMLKREREPNERALEYTSLSCDDLRSMIRLLIYAADSLA